MNINNTNINNNIQFKGLQSKSTAITENFESQIKTMIENLLVKIQDSELVNIIFERFTTTNKKLFATDFLLEISPDKNKGQKELILTLRAYKLPSEYIAEEILAKGNKSDILAKLNNKDFYNELKNKMTKLSETLKTNITWYS